MSELSFAAKYFLSTRCFSFRVLVPRLAIRVRAIFRGLACRALASVNLRLDCTVSALMSVFASRVFSDVHGEEKRFHIL